MQHLERIKKIKMLITDVDGVLTDGRIWLDSQFKWKRAFHVLDGVGLKLLMEAGYKVAVITGGEAEDVRFRMKFLKVDYFYDGAADKMPPFHDLVSKVDIALDEMAYIGDEIYDLPVMEKVGFRATVPSAIGKVKNIADYVTKNPAGYGAAREVCDLILQHGFYSTQAGVRS